MSATLARKGVGRVDLRFRESDLVQQLVKGRVAACDQGSLEAEAEAETKAEAAADARRIPLARASF